MQDPVIDEVLATLGQFNPKSVFLYGSRARRDFTPVSDYEVGIIFDSQYYVNRSSIHEAIKTPKVRVYPFKWDELLHGTFDTPFQKPIHLREIITGGRTIAGEHIIEQLPPPPITTFDLVQRIRFDIGYSLAAILSMRSGDIATCHDEFSKSCLFGVRCLEILELRVFPVGYDEIYELSSKVATQPEFVEVIKSAYGLRQEGKDVKSDIIFQNISLLNFIENKIVESFKTLGDRQLA